VVTINKKRLNLNYRGKTLKKKKGKVKVKTQEVKNAMLTK